MQWENAGARAQAADLCVSLVLYKTQRAEVEHVIELIMTEEDVNTVVFVIDNSPDIMESLWFSDPRVHYIPSGGNLGYGKGHNRGIFSDLATAPYHLVMNTDIDFSPGTLKAMIAFMDARPDAVLSMPRVNYPDGRIQTLCRLLPTPVNLFFRRFLGQSQYAKTLDDSYELRWWGYDKVANIPFLSGCFMMMRRDVVCRIGGFDERFFVYGEDLDLSRRMHAVGLTLLNPDVQIVHEYRSKRGFSWQILKLQVTNLSRYFNKWGWVFDPERKQVNAKAIAALVTRDAPLN